MPKSNLLEITRSIDDLASEMERFVPIGLKGTDGFRADLAGLLVVKIAACYEDCVKTTLVGHAATRHVDFEDFTERNFSRLSSKVKVNDLNRYAKLFGVTAEQRFKDSLRTKREKISRRTGINIEKRYHQILDWRHDYAHGGIKNTTISEALEFHVYGIRVLHCFNEAFDC
jgi:hypothetical protein